MFEFEVQGLRHWRVRLGRVNLRTWRPLFMKLPRGYRSPEIIYQVVSVSDKTDSIDHELAAFDSESDAKKLIEELKAEGGHGNLGINLIPVHARVEDWEFDR